MRLFASFGVGSNLGRVLIVLVACASPWSSSVAQSDMHRAVADGAHDMFQKKVGKDKAASTAAMRPGIASGVGKAQALLKEKRFQEALAQLALVDVPNKTDEETEVVESTRGTAALGMGDTDLALRSLSVLLGLPSLSSQYKQAVAQTLADLMWKNKRYAESAAWIERYFAEGGTEQALRVLLAKSFYLASQYEKAAVAMRAVVQHADEAGQLVQKDQLQILASSYAQTKNDAGYVATLERLVRTYPTPAYWADLLARVVNRANFDDRLRWSAYELQVATQSMADEDYFYMAQLAAQQSYWVSAKNILERHPLVRANHDAEFLAEYDRMLVLVQTKSKQMIEELPKTQSQVLAGSNAVALFRLGRTQVELGKTESGLELMTRALKLGGFKNPDDYWLRLAGALAAANQREGALEALRQVASGTGGAELARLWSLFLQGPALSR